MKKILCFIDSLGPGGAQRQIVGLACFLKEKGYDVSVVTYHDNRFYVDQLLSNGVPYIYLKKAENKLTRFWHVARYIRRIKPDVVISYLETPSICACVSHIFNRKFKLIVSERNTTQHTGKNENIRFRLFKKADFVVPNAFAQKDYILQNFPTLENKVIAIPNFVDLNHFATPKRKERRDIPEILVAATIWGSKNTLGFIDAVYKLKEKGYNFHISWYGKNEAHIDYFNQCQEKINRFNIEKYITLKDKTTQINKIYQDADYFCLPSFYEGTPNVICEAMASGLPIVCSDVCDNSNYVIEGKNGFLFNPKNVDSIVAAFERLFALTTEDYSALCKYSRELAESKLSKETFLNSYIKLIEQ